MSLLALVISMAAVAAVLFLIAIAPYITPSIKKLFSVIVLIFWVVWILIQLGVFNVLSNIKL